MAQERETSVSITRIVAASFCEQKVVLDRTYGPKKTAEVACKAAQGDREHLRFEREGKLLAARGPITPQQVPASASETGADRRCFIASAVYGVDAPETNMLRAWRDRVLKVSFLGRCFIRFYYRVSPRVAMLINGRPWLQRQARRMLDTFLNWIKR